MAWKWKLNLRRWVFREFTSLDDAGMPGADVRRDGFASAASARFHYKS